MVRNGARLLGESGRVRGGVLARARVRAGEGSKRMGLETEVLQVSIGQALDQVQAGVLCLDRELRVVLLNAVAARILGREGAQPELHCHDLFPEEAGIGADCRAAEPPAQKSYTLEGPGGKKMLLKIHFTPWREYLLLTLFDVTREVTMLKKIDWNRKETQTKNVLLERRCQKAKEEVESLRKLIDQLPDAIVQVDELYEIQGKNKAVAELVSSGATKCHELLGNDFPCDECPVVDGFAVAHGQKKSHTVGERIFTEHIIQSPSGEGGVLLFADTTRQVSLIAQIREQQAAIYRQNATLTGLADLENFMRKESDLEKVMRYFLQLFLPMLGCTAAIIAVNDLRPGNLWLSLAEGVSEEELKVFARAYLSREVHELASGTVPGEYLPWPVATQVCLQGGNGRRVGTFVLEGEWELENNRFLIYAEPLGAYIHNRLLMRQLEEKANTDPMTGLFNRGYLEQALAEEQVKLERYGIHHAVVMADANRLKKVNDHYGHEAGDLLIRKVAELLQEAVRGTDIVARTGGDEFIILLTGASEEEAELFVGRLRNNIFAGAALVLASGDSIPVLVSLGSAGTDVHPVEELLKVADRRMYEDKERYYRKQKRYR